MKEAIVLIKPTLFELVEQHATLCLFQVSKALIYFSPASTFTFTFVCTFAFVSIWHIAITFWSKIKPRT